MPSRPTLELTGDGSWPLLASVPLGRIVFTMNALPAIPPVNHLTDGKTIIIRSHLGGGDRGARHRGRRRAGVTELLAGAEFRRMCRTFEHTAFRLETRERYVDEKEQEPLRRFLAGEPPDDAWFMDWSEAVEQRVARGRRTERVRVVSEPHSGYTRFGMDLARRLNVPSGEDIRYLARDQARELGLPDEDFWLFDSARVLIIHFDGDTLLGAELVTDAAEVIKHCRWRDVAWHYAIPLDNYAGA